MEIENIGFVLLQKKEFIINSLEKLIEDANTGVLDPALYALNNEEDFDEQDERSSIPSNNNNHNKKSKKKSTSNKKNNKKYKKGNNKKSASNLKTKRKISCLGFQEKIEW